MSLLDEFQKKRVLVVGDVMIDRYVYGHTTRISPEAPVPIVRITGESNILGGAGNTAGNIASLGASTTLLSVIGKDDDGKLVKKLLNEKGITAALVEDPTRPTIVKKRVISGNNHQLIRLDYEETHKINPKTEESVLGSMNKISGIDIILISDYAKGMMTERLAGEIGRYGRKNNIPIIVDTKPRNAMFYSSISILKVNLKEAREITGEEDVEMAGRVLVKKIKSPVFITRGSEGISIFDRKLTHTHVLQGKIAKVFDVTGAGDTVLAVSALCLACKQDLLFTARLANYGASIVVQKPGTSTLTREDLRSFFA